MNPNTSVLIGQTTTDILDVMYHDNTRSEFRLTRDNIFDSDIRLGGLGATIVGVANIPYVYSAGVEALIRNIHIYNGSDLLDELVDSHQVSAFMNMLRGNGRNNNVSKATLATSIGYFVPQSTNAGAYVAPVAQLQTLTGAQSLATSNSATTFLGTVRLAKLLGFLKSAPNLNTYVLKDLRVVIEYRPQSDMGFIFAGDASAITSFTVAQPQLFVDKMVGVDPVKAISDYSFQFEVMEQEQVYVPDAIAVKVRLNAFNGKLLNRLLMINSDQTVTANGTIDNVGDDKFKYDGSLRTEAEVIQILVNGNPLLNFNGNDSEARKLQKLSDAFGEINMSINSNKTELGQPAVATLTDAVTSYFDNASYGGFVVGQRINQLDLSYARTTATAIIMYVYGEVTKSFASSGGNYVIAYA